jgi:CheY-like chemotaxis protein
MTTNTAPLKVLLVEDNFLIAAALEGRILQIGHEVIAIVDTGEEAVQRAQTLAPDLVLMDIKLQEGAMNGLEAAAQIRAQGLTMPILYTSAYIDDNTFQAAQATEPYATLPKPFSIGQLREAIAALIERHER